MDKFESLKKYKELLDEGIIDQDEFNAKKEELLNAPESIGSELKAKAEEKAKNAKAVASQKAKEAVDKRAEEREAKAKAKAEEKRKKEAERKDKAESEDRPKGKLKFFIIGIVLVFILISLFSCGGNTSEDSEAYKIALEKYYDSACYVLEDGGEYHHSMCETFPDDYSFWIYNKEAAKSEGYRACEKCWDMSVSDFVNTYYNGSYKDAATKIVSDTAVTIEEDSKYYHRIGCSHIADYGYWMNNINAIDEDYEPCPDCWSGDNANAATYIENTFGEGSDIKDVENEEAEIPQCKLCENPVFEDTEYCDNHWNTDYSNIDGVPSFGNLSGLSNHSSNADLMKSATGASAAYAYYFNEENVKDVEDYEDLLIAKGFTPDSDLSLKGGTDSKSGKNIIYYSAGTSLMISYAKTEDSDLGDYVLFILAR